MVIPLFLAMNYYNTTALYHLVVFFLYTKVIPGSWILTTVIARVMFCKC